MQYVNLKQRFGDPFNVQYEERYYADRGEHARAEDLWLMVIPCQNGEICPWGGENLAACTKSSGAVAKRLKALPFVTVAQDGADAANVLFPVEHFGIVAEIMRPRKRYRLSPEEAQRRAQRIAKYGFGPTEQHPDAAPVSTIRPQCDSEAAWGRNGAVLGPEAP